MKKFFIPATVVAVSLLAACDPKSKQDPQKPDVVAPTYEILFTDIKVTPLTDEIQFEAESASSNGKYMAGTNQVGFMPAVWDIDKGEVITLQGNYAESNFHSVSNDGTAVGGVHTVTFPDVAPDWWDPDWYGEFVPGEYAETSLNTYPAVFKNGNLTMLPLPDGYTSAEAYDISDDAKTICGFAFDDATYRTNGCVWVEENGSYKLLTIIEVPANYGVALDPLTEARFMSADGNILLGFVQDNNTGEWPLCVWKRNGSKYDMLYSACQLGYDTVDEETWVCKGDYKAVRGDQAAVSANGKYIAAILVTDMDENWHTDSYAALVNLETSEVVLTENLTPYDPESFMDPQFSVTGVADNGTVLLYAGGSGIGPLSTRDAGLDDRTAYVWEAGSKELKALSTYPGADRLASFASVTPVWMASDCSAIAGFALNEMFECQSFMLY